MKIFDKSNDEGKPEHTWIEGINRVHHPQKIEYNVIQSVTLMPDNLNSAGINSFHLHRRSPISLRKNSYNNSINDDSKRNTSSPVKLTNVEERLESRIRVHSTRRNIELSKTTTECTLQRTDDHIEGASPRANVDMKTKTFCEKRNSKDEDGSPNSSVKMLVKVLNDQKKETERLKENKQFIIKENISLSEKLKAQESLFIKTFSQSPKRQIINSKMGLCRVQNINTDGKKANYQENIKTMVHHKYLKKMEDQEIEHQKQMNEFKVEYANQIEEMTELIAEMSRAMINLQAESAAKYRDMFDIILEKDVRIEELEQVESKMNNCQEDMDLYSLKTKVNALKMNLKQSNKKIDELEKSKKKLEQVVAQMKTKEKLINFGSNKNSIKNKKELNKNHFDYKQDLIRLINI